MNGAADLLSRYLRQRVELGETELVFEGQPLRSLKEAASVRVAPTPSRTTDRTTHRPIAAAGTRPSGVEPPPLVALGSLGELGRIASVCTACELAETRNHVVFGEGSAQADLVVVGEAPGADEDRSGRPFVGRAGKLLDQLLAAIGFPRESVYICNVLKCRPPRNRNPSPDEVASCSPFLQRQLALLQPKAILACGTFSAQTLLESSEPIGRLRGVVHAFEGIPLVPTYHPAALLRNPGWIRPVWEDLQRLRTLLDAE